MSIILNAAEPAIVRGIKTVGVGKKGSKPLSHALALEILEDLRRGKVAPAAKGAFWAGLLAKGIEADEQVLAEFFDPGVLLDPLRLVNALSPDAPEFIRWVCVSLMKGHTLDLKTAYDVGRFLLSHDPGDTARGFIASYLRVRYETDDEYEGLWQAMQEGVASAFKGPTPPGNPIIQLAEPFDGNDHSYLITPLIGQYLQSLGYRVVHMVGRNSGPKLVFNVLDVIDHLDVTYVTSNQDLARDKPAFGWFVRQADVAPGLDRWVELRRQIVKRPFLATLEKFIKPLAADIIVTSAFHPPYGEKMLAIAERAGFKGAMVIRNGIEGSMAFPLKRPAKMLLSARQESGQYRRHEIEFDVEHYLGQGPEIEERRDQLTAMENARLIQAYADKGSSADAWFDARVKVTCAGFYQGLSWLKENVYGLG